MVEDKLLDIAEGMSANSKVWKNRKRSWSWMVTKLTTENKTNETYAQYMSSTRAERSKIKDVGGFVGGYLNAGRRKAENIAHRQLLTLDIDFGDLNFWMDFSMQFDNAAVLHATHTHSAKTPKYRLIMPLSREVSADEYLAVTRKVAGTIDIEQFDNTGFQPHRLMFWPSNPIDVPYYCRVQNGPWLDVDEVLNSYVNWKDSSEWPTSAAHLESVHDLSVKQQDPEIKKGIIGAFCRTYNMHECINEFLSDQYKDAGTDRYTYVRGSTFGGLIVYEDKFAFSHHGTDPCSGKLCNAFDLVRIHKFGHLDSPGQHNPVKQKSFAAMQEMARELPAVKQLLGEENFENAKYEFRNNLEPHEEPEEDDLEWVKDLEVDNKSKYLSSANNLNIIMRNDKRIAGAFKHNEFDTQNYICKSVPWRKITEPETIKNVDFSGLRNYLESIYSIVGAFKIEDALNLEFDRNKFNPIKDYLNSLKWDKVQRVDKLLVEYFGAPDTVYSREAIRKPLVAAVARIFRPGTKFDLVLTLVGKQGTFKSTFFAKLGMSWYSDSFNTVHGKESFEQLQGSWILEVAELSGFRKAEREAVKHYITKTEDRYRPAFGRVVETFKRQVIFFATTNDYGFLNDPSGNRRFMPVNVLLENITKDVRQMSKSEIDAIWAEAVHLYKSVWCECLRKKYNDIDRYKTRELNDTLKNIPGWEFVNSTKRFPIYGIQKYYKKL